MSSSVLPIVNARFGQTNPGNHYCVRLNSRLYPRIWFTVLVDSLAVIGSCTCSIFHALNSVAMPPEVPPTAFFGCLEQMC